VTSLPPLPVEARRPLVRLLAAGALGVLALATLPACDGTAATPVAQPSRAMRPDAGRPAPVAGMPRGAPAVSHGAAALEAYRPDLDPSHAAVGDYRD